MFNKVKNIFYIISFVFFIAYIIFFYFSNENIILVNKSRALYSSKSKINIMNLPLLKNDTNNIIVFSNDIEIYKKNKKNYKFWDLIRKQSDE